MAGRASVPTFSNARYGVFMISRRIDGIPQHHNGGRSSAAKQKYCRRSGGDDGDSSFCLILFRSVFYRRRARSRLSGGRFPVIGIII